MLYNHENYTIDIAEKLKELSHTDDEPHWSPIYGLADVEAFIANQKLVKGYHLLCEINDDLRFARDERPVPRHYFSFYITKNFIAGNNGSKRAAKEGCKTVANKIISRYIKDYKADAAVHVGAQTWGLAGLEVESISMRTIGPLGDNYIGTFVSFTLVNQPDYAYNESDWSE